MFRIMKLFSVFMFVFVFGTAASSFSQQQIVTLNMHQCDVGTLLKEIRKQTGLRFVFNEEHIMKVDRFDVVVKNKTVKEVLDNVFAKSDLKWYFENDVIFIVHQTSPKVAQDSILSVKGIVKDEKGEVLPGVTILVKGTTLGVATDVNGKFTLHMPQRDSVVLLVSFIGYQTETVYVGKNNKELDIQLKLDVTEIAEVVITGYGKVDKRLSASATTSIKMDDIRIPNVASVDAMLQGRVPGLMVMTSSGSPNATPRMRIRGSSTIHGNAAPVWVVDGIIQEDPVDLSNDEINNVIAGTDATLRGQLNDNASFSLLGNAISGVNPSDIETITFLKDASATAIYGTRAANGVIVVTTKKGQVGKPSVNFSSSFGFTARPRYEDYHLMNSKERVGVSREVAESGYLYSIMPFSTGYEGALFDYYDGKINKNEFDARVASLETMNTDWFKILFRNAFNQDYALSVSGGTENTRYYLSVGFNDSKGSTKGDNLRRYNVNMNVNTKIGRFVDVEGKLSFSDRKSDGFYMVNPLDYALKASRAIGKDEF